MLIKNGDIVKRTDEYKGAQEPCGTRIAVVRHVSPGVLLLDGYDSIYDPSDFEVFVAMSPQVPQDSPPEALRIYEALSVIREWNGTHPDGMSIGVESGDPRNGGTLFTLGERFDSHEPLDVFSEIVDQLVTSDQQEALHLLTMVLQARCTKR